MASIKCLLNLQQMFGRTSPEAEQPGNCAEIRRRLFLLAASRHDADCARYVVGPRYLGRPMPARVSLKLFSALSRIASRQGATEAATDKETLFLCSTWRGGEFFRRRDPHVRSSANS